MHRYMRLYVIQFIFRRALAMEISYQACPAPPSCPCMAQLPGPHGLHGPGMDDETRSSAAAAAIDPHLHEFTVSLQNLLAALRRCSAVEIPCASMAAEADRSCNFEARFQDARTCMEQLCDEMLRATGVAARDCDRGACSSPANLKSPDTADGRRYTPRCDPDGLFKALLKYVSISIDVFRARRGLFELRPDMDQAAHEVLNHKALEEICLCCSASAQPAYTRPQCEQLLQRMHAELQVYVNGGCDSHLAADAMLLHSFWRKTYARASRRRSYLRGMRAPGDCDSSPGSSCSQELDADFAAEAARPASTLATAAVAAIPMAVAILPMAAAIRKDPPSPACSVDSSYSYSYSYSYSEDEEPAPASAGAGTRSSPAVTKTIYKRPSTATAVVVHGRAPGCGQTPRTAGACRLGFGFMRRVLRARRAAGKAVRTASRSAGAAAAAASEPATAIATAAVQHALSAAPVNPVLQGAPAQAKQKAALQKRLVLKRKPAAAAAAAPAAAAAAPTKNTAMFTKQVSETLKDASFRPDLKGRVKERFSAAVAATKAARAATAALQPTKFGCSKCRRAEAGCSACRRQ